MADQGETGPEPSRSTTGSKLETLQILDEIMVTIEVSLIVDACMIGSGIVQVGPVAVWVCCALIRILGFSLLTQALGEARDATRARAGWFSQLLMRAWR